MTEHVQGKISMFGVWVYLNSDYEIMIRGIERLRVQAAKRTSCNEAEPRSRAAQKCCGSFSVLECTYLYLFEALTDFRKV